jgi:hypothetical protein
MNSIMNVTLSSCNPAPSGAALSGKKYATGTSSASDIAFSRLAPIRFVPFSYFWIC